MSTIIKRSLMILFISLAFSVTCHNNYDEKFYSCNHRIYSDTSLLSQNELHHLCDLLLKRDRFTIFITERREVKKEEDYSKESEQFFNKHCLFNTIPCNYDFTISIFTNVKKLRITSGKSSSNMLSRNQWDTITQAMLSKLKRSDYYDAIEDGINWLDQSAPYNSSIDFPKHEEEEHKKKKGSFGFGSFVLFILLPCCGCGALYYFYYYKPMQENKNENSESIMTPLTNALMSEGFSSNSQKDVIHFHIMFLLDLLNHIKAQIPPIYNSDKCIICQQKIQCVASKQYIEMLQINQLPQDPYNTPTQPLTQSQIQSQANDSINTRFGCLHLYHKACLKKYNIIKCIMCYQSSVHATEVIPNNYDTHIIEESHVMSLLRNFPLLYSFQNLKDYSSSYRDEFIHLNQSLVPYLSSIWQITPYDNSIAFKPLNSSYN